MKIKIECQQVCRTAHSNHMKTMFDDDKHNTKLWTYIKSKNQEQTGIPDLKHNEKTIQDPKEKSNILNSQFASVFSDPIPEISLNVQDSETNTTMDDLKINKNGLLKLLNNINGHKATGPDDIPGHLLKLLAYDILDVYTILFQASLTQSGIPNDWKKAKNNAIIQKR